MNEADGTVVLTTVVTADEVRVVAADDERDWFIAFRREPDFPAQAWADNVVRIYNSRESILR